MPSWLCDLALAAGMTFSGACQSALPAADPLPADDPAAWSHKAPAPPPEAPKPPPPMPPVVIRQEIVREVTVPAPVPPPPPPVIPVGPDPYELAVRASYQSRAGGAAASAAGWSDISVPAPGLDVSGLPIMPISTNTDGPAREYEEKHIRSTAPVDNSRILTTDRYINGILETGINTQLDGANGGTVVIQVTRNVFGYHGRNMLVPKGSRLVCGFKSLDKVGSSRAPLRCSRLLLGESRAEIFGMKANVSDVQGQLGVSGVVDNRFAERYGTAFILAGVSAAVRAATAQTGSTSSTSTASSTGSSSTFSGSGGALSEGGAELSQRLGEITAATLEQTLNLTPILKVAQGTRVVIRPDTDWYIAEME